MIKYIIRCIINNKKINWHILYTNYFIYKWNYNKRKIKYNIRKIIPKIIWEIHNYYYTFLFRFNLVTGFKKTKLSSAQQFIGEFIYNINMQIPNYIILQVYNCRGEIRRKKIYNIPEELDLEILKELMIFPFETIKKYNLEERGEELLNFYHKHYYINPPFIYKSKK